MPIPLLARVMATAASAASGASGGSATGMIGRAAGSALSAGKRKAMEDGIIKGPKSMRVTAQKSLQKLTGIQFSAGAIMKQSQLFSGIMGGFFQILGAFVDVLLMPLMPIFTRLLMWMAGGIPKLAGGVAQIEAYLKDNWAKSEGSIMEFIGRLIGDAIKWLIIESAKLIWMGLMWLANPINWFKALNKIGEWTGDLFAGILIGIVDGFWGIIDGIFGHWVGPVNDLLMKAWEWVGRAWEWLTQFTWVNIIVDHFKALIDGMMSGIGGGIVGGIKGGLSVFKNPFSQQLKGGDISQPTKIEIIAGPGIEIDDQSAYSSTIRAQARQESIMFDMGPSLGGGP